MKDASKASQKPGATLADTYRLPLPQWNAYTDVCGGAITWLSGKAKLVLCSSMS